MGARRPRPFRTWTWRSAALCLACALAWAPAPSAAQPIDPLRRYDLRGERTVDAIRVLDATTPSGAPAAAVRARLEAARAATDLWVISYLDPDHDDLADRVATALGVPRDVLAQELVYRIERLGSGPRTEEMLETVALVRALALRGNGVSFAGTEGLRRDALVVDAVARAIAIDDGAAMISMFGDPCASGDACDDPWARWAPSSRARIAALAEASAAARRLEDAAAAGDPFAIAVRHIVDGPARTVAAHVVRPIPRVGDDVPCGASMLADEPPVAADVVIAISTDEVRISRISPVRVVDGRIELVLDGEDVAPAATVVSLRRDRVGPIWALAHVLRAMALPEGARIAIAAGDDVPANTVGRVLFSMHRAATPATVLVRRAADGTLRGVAMRVVTPHTLDDDDDLRVRAATAGYVVARGGRTELEAPNEEALWHRLVNLEARHVVVDAVGPAPSRELYDVAFRLARGGGRVDVVTP